MGLSNFFQVRRSGSFEVARHCTSRRPSPRMVSCSGEDRDDAGIKNGGRLNSRQHAASKTPSCVIGAGSRSQRDRQVRPVHQIRTDGMGPVHVSPHSRPRVVLEKHMILAAIEAWRTGIVHPVSLRQQMKLWPQWIASKFLSERGRKLFFTTSIGAAVQCAKGRSRKGRDNKPSAIHKWLSSGRNSGSVRSFTTSSLSATPIPGLSRTTRKPSSSSDTGSVSEV